MRPWPTPAPLLSASLASAAARVVLVGGEGLREPFGVDFDAAGRSYIVEMQNRVSVLDPKGTLRVLAGNGIAGFGGEGGPAAQALFNGPHHLLMGPDGAPYVADTWNYSVRRIDLQSQTITRVAGTGVKGYGGDGGSARDAQFGGIFSIAFRGARLYACDLDNRRIRAIDLKTGVVTTVAGNGEKGVPKDGEDARSQPLVDPRAIALDGKGNLYICERGGHALRVVDPSGKIRTVAGTGERGFSDTENHVIRRYSSKDGRVTRVAGTGTNGSGGFGGPALSLQLNRPHGVGVHPSSGVLYISDSENHRVLRIER